MEKGLRLMGHRPRVVIVGAGFGGLWAARTLARAPVDVVLLDRNNYHTFFPLLYQVAAAELSPEEIVHPVRSILRPWLNVSFLMGNVSRIDLAARVLQANGSAIPYDYLILAIGSTTGFFGVPGAAEHSFPLKSLDQGIRLRNHILCCFERATREADPERLRQMLTFVIVGGGPTGVEFAGALAELLHKPLVRDFPRLDFRKTRVVLLEAAGRLLPALPEKLSRYAHQRLTRMGVEVVLQTAVSEISPRSAVLKDGSAIPTETVVWTAGVRGEPIAQAWGLPVDRSGRIMVNAALQLQEHPEVFVVGDVARSAEDNGPLPMIAPVAIQQGVAAARNIQRQIAGQPLLPFRYHDRGTMATIGRNAAVADLGGRTFTGFPAWVIWLGVHLFNLIGFRNRLIVLINWAWDYFLYERALRLILPTTACGPGTSEDCGDKPREGQAPRESLINQHSRQ